MEGVPRCVVNTATTRFFHIRVAALIVDAQCPIRMRRKKVPKTHKLDLISGSLDYGKQSHRRECDVQLLDFVRSLVRIENASFNC